MKKLLIIPALVMLCGICKAQSVELTAQYVHISMTDSTLQFQIAARSDTLGMQFEDHLPSRTFSLKSSTDRDSLRNFQLVHDVLIRMGQFLSNQFPPE